MSNLVTGLSMKVSDVPNSQQLNDNHSIQKFKEQEEDDSSCCYGKCIKYRYCRGYILCGVCKSSYDNGMCVLVALMVSCLLLGVIVPVILNGIVNVLIDQQVVVDSTSAPNYEAWQTNAQGPGTDVQIGYDIYFFDVQNPKEILQGAKPIVTEVGPYAYNEFYVKFDISWSDGGNVVTYNTQRYYIFDEERTGAGLSESDEITLPYPTALAFSFLLSQIPYNTTVLVDQYIQVTLIDLLFVATKICFFTVCLIPKIWSYRI